MTSTPRLEKTRFEIEQLTLKIVELVGRRTVLAGEVASEKLKTGQALVNREVENNLRVKVVEQCRIDKSDPSFALSLLNELIMESIRKQEQHFEPKEPVTAYHIFVKAKELERSGKEVIHLEVGEPDFGPPITVAESLTKAAIQGKAGYTQSAGILELRTKIADYVNKTHSLEISSDQVIVTVGGRFAIYLSLVTSLRPGEEVIVIDPSYPAYSECIREAGGRPVHVTTHLENDWNLDLGTLEDCINKTTRMIILNSPCNPTGKILDKSTLDNIAELSIENDICIVSDEVYNEFSFSPHTSLLQFPECDQIYVNSFSKTFGMTGFRLGYAISDKATVQRMTQLQNLSLTSAPEFIQYAGIEALDCMDEARGFAAMIEKRQSTICKRLENLPVSFYRPDGGFYVFPRLDNLNANDLVFADKLLTEKGVAIAPGTGYGQEFDRFFRISVCQPEKLLIEAMSRMEEILQ